MMRRSSGWTWLALIGCLLLAAALRFHRLGAQDIWGDEAFSISLSLEPVARVIAGGADTHPPLYPLVLLEWLRLVGISALATRALSAFAGILVVPLVHVFGRRIAPERPPVAWMAMLLAAVSPLLIYYSQETRMYEMVTLLSLASAYFCVALLHMHRPVAPAGGWRARSIRVAGYLVFTLAALYTHYSAFFILAAENIAFAVYWFKHRRELRRAPVVNWVVLQTLLVAGYLPWIAAQTLFLSGKASARFDEWGWRGIELVFGKTFLAFAAGLSVEFPIVQITAALFLALAALGLAAARGIDRERSSVVWLAPLCFAVPLVIAWLVDPVMPFFFERYVLVALPGFIVTVALGLDWMARRDAGAAMVLLSVLVLTGAFSLVNYYDNDAYAKGKYGQMMAYVAAQAQPGDVLVLNNPLQKPLYNYYQPQGIPAFFLPDGVPLEDPNTRRQLAEIAASHSRIWLVMFGNPAEYDPTGYLERWLGANAFRTYTQGYVDARLSLYAMPGGATTRRTVRATIGDSIQLTGYDLNRSELSPGQTLQLILHWQVTAPVARQAKVFTHILGEFNPATLSPVWAQMDGEPVGGSRPTTGWHAGETIDDAYGLEIPGNAPPGEYTLEIGMYDAATLERLAVRDESGARVTQDRVILGTVRIK